MWVGCNWCFQILLSVLFLHLSNFFCEEEEEEGRLKSELQPAGLQHLLHSTLICQSCQQVKDQVPSNTQPRHWRIALAMPHFDSNFSTDDLILDSPQHNLRPSLYLHLNKNSKPNATQDSNKSMPQYFYHSLFSHGSPSSLKDSTHTVALNIYICPRNLKAFLGVGQNFFETLKT